MKLHLQYSTYIWITSFQSTFFCGIGHFSCLQSEQRGTNTQYISHRQGQYVLNLTMQTHACYLTALGRRTYPMRASISGKSFSKSTLFTKNACNHSIWSAVYHTKNWLEPTKEPAYTGGWGKQKMVRYQLAFKAGLR